MFSDTKMKFRIRPTSGKVGVCETIIHILVEYWGGNAKALAATTNRNGDLFFRQIIDLDLQLHEFFFSLSRGCRRSSYHTCHLEAIDVPTVCQFDVFFLSCDGANETGS